MQTPQSHRPRPWHRAPPGGCPGARQRRSDSARVSLQAAPVPLLRDGEKLWGTADSPAKRREHASSKKLLKAAGHMLSSRAARASWAPAGWDSRWGGGRARQGEVPPAGRLQTDTQTPPRAGRASTGSPERLDELLARIWAAAPLWAGCWYQTLKCGV